MYPIQDNEALACKKKLDSMKNSVKPDSFIEIWKCKPTIGIMLNKAMNQILYKPLGYSI